MTKAADTESKINVCDDKTIARLPIATFAVVAITAIVTRLQWLYPALLPALDRNQAALLAGQW